MQNDDVFRFVLILGFVLVFPISLYYRLKIGSLKGTIEPQGGGTVHSPDPGAHRCRQDVRHCDVSDQPGLGGVGFGVTAATLLIYVFRSLGTNLTDTVVTRARHTLVTTGPYRWVRHPFYVAFALAVTADSLVTASWFLALTGGAAVGLIFLRTRIEEEKLVDRFGAEYKEYMQRTGRFFPGLQGG